MQQDFGKGSKKKEMEISILGWVGWSGVGQFPKNKCVKITLKQSFSSPFLVDGVGGV